MTKIDYISDIHTSCFTIFHKDLFWKNGIIKKSWKDILVIAWDINENIYQTEKILNQIIDTTEYKKIIITFGNHDIRMTREDRIRGLKNSIEKYEFLINYFHWYRNKIHFIDREDYIMENEIYDF